ncbi:Com family DNA-binding transcriptional regulator [Bifidobacterium aquikefiri]
MLRCGACRRLLCTADNLDTYVL